MASIGTFGSMPLLYKLDFDPQRAFAPVATVVYRQERPGGPPVSCR